MEDLSLEQHREMINTCATDPDACRKRYGNLLTNGVLVREAIDRVLGDDVPSRMKNDMSSVLAQQIEAEGIVSSTDFAQRLKDIYGLDSQQADILAGAALGAVTGGMSKGKGSAIPVPDPVKANNGLVYKSHSKHTLGSEGNRPNAGIEPKNSLSLFEGSVPLTIKGKEHKARYTMDSNGDIHRFSPDNAGSYHWSGSSADKKNKLVLPNDVKAALKKQEGWKIK